MARDAAEIGRLWALSSRTGQELPDGCDPRAVRLDDESLWAALLGALEVAEGDTELFLVADLLVTELNMTRPALDDRLPELCRTNPAALEMARMMADPERNPWGKDPQGKKAFWKTLAE